MALSACAKGERGDVGPQGQATSLPVVDSTDADIAKVLADENAYRLSLGQTVLSQGLSCSVQAVASGQWLSSSSPGYNAGQGVIVVTGSSYSFLLTNELNQPDTSGSLPFQILPTALQTMFLNKNLKMVCSGQVVVLETAYYAFDLNSDDGSILTIDGAQVINNDGNHGMTLRSGTKLLRRGVHTFNIQYAQTGSGNQGLVLTANGSTIQTRFFAH